MSGKSTRTRTRARAIPTGPRNDGPFVIQRAPLPRLGKGPYYYVPWGTPGPTESTNGPKVQLT